MSTEPEVLDAEIVHDAPAESTSLELAPRQRRSEVIRPLDAGQLVDSFKAYQNLLPQLLDGSDYQDAGRGKRFVKKSGWRKIATAFDLDVVRVHEEVERDEAGHPVRAKAIYRAIAPSGRMMDGDGYCSVEEDRFSGPRGNKSKLENDLRATATTRAKNRAISDLVGMGDVSAEEVGDDQQHQAGPPFGEALPKNQNPLVGKAISTLLAVAPDDVPDPGPFAQAVIKDAGGYFPAIVGRTILRLEEALLQRSQAAQGGEPS